MSRLMMVLARKAVSWPELPAETVRLLFNLACLAMLIAALGITASHSLSFEIKAPTHAKFDEAEAVNRWNISSRTLRQVMDHFGPGIELLDINTDDGTRVVNFTCFTDKVQKRGATIDEGTLILSSCECCN